MAIQIWHEACLCGGDGARSTSEILDVEVRLLAGLPVPVELEIAPGPGLDPIDVIHDRNLLRQSRRRASQRRLSMPFIELETAAYAVQEQRAFAQDWRAWLHARRSNPRFFLSPQIALARAHGLECALEHARLPPIPLEPRITLRAFLRAVDASLLSVRMLPSDETSTR